MSSVAFVQGGSAAYGAYTSGHAGQVLPADATPGDAIVLLPYSYEGVVGVSAGFGPIAAFNVNTTECPYICAEVTTSADTATVTTEGSGVWYAGALEFGANGGFGTPRNGNANLNGQSNVSAAFTAIQQGGSTASATVENVTAGAAYVVYAFSQDYGSFNGLPGAPWTPYNTLFSEVGTGCAWLIAENDDPIPFTFETGPSDTVLVWLVEILPPPVPTVSGVSPSAGVTGDSVTVTGTNFIDATGVAFGGASATFTVNSATSISATAPAGTGTVDVTVTNANGTSPTSAADEFAYVWAGPFSVSVALSQAQAQIVLT
jgi:hypothetical protein